MGGFYLKMKDIENPKPSKGDVAHTAIKAAISAVPVIGGPGAEFFSAIIKPPLEKRRNEFFDSIVMRLNELEKREVVQIKNLSQNKIFITVIMHATQSAIKNHQKEKLDALRNAVLNSAIIRSPDEDLQIMFISYIDDLTEWHLRILKFLSNPNTWHGDITPEMNQVEQGKFFATFNLGKILANNFPQLQGEYGFYQQVIRDLNTRGLIKTDSLKFTTPTDGKMNMDCVTDIGEKFIDYITSPLDKMVLNKAI